MVNSLQGNQANGCARCGPGCRAHAEALKGGLRLSCKPYTPKWLPAEFTLQS